MTAAPFQLLLLEDNAGDARLVREALAEHAPGEFALTCVERLADALVRIGAKRFDIVLCDLGLPDSAGLATARAVIDRAPALPLVVLTGSHDQDLGRAAIVFGAQDYLVKEKSSWPMIARTLRYAIERKRLELGVRTANEALERRVAERTAELQTTLAKLRESLSRARALAETATDAIIIADREGTIVVWNRAAERLFGYARSEAIGQAITLVIPQRYRGDHRIGVKRILVDGERSLIGRTVELHGLTKAGGEFPLELSVSTWETAEGRMFAGIIRDISERKREEHRRRLEAKRLEVSLALNKMLGESEQAVLDYILEECLRITESRHSFIGWINEDESVMTVHAWSKDAMAQCAVDNVPLVFPLAEAGLWAEPIRQRRTVIINDCAQPHEYKQSVPAGHVEIKRYLGVPIFERDRIVLIVAVANKESAYAQSDADSLTSVMTDAWRLIQRNRAEARLQQNEERFRGLVETSSDWIWEVDQNGIYTYVSPRVRDILGYEPEEVLGRTPFDLMPPEEIERVAAVFQETAAERRPMLLLENTNRHKDGRLVVLETSGVPVIGADGTFRGYRGVDRDITERKEAQEALRAAEEQFRGLVEQSIAGIYIIQDGKFAYVNPRTVEITGYDSADQLIGRDPLSLVAEMDRGLVAQNMRERIEGLVFSKDYEFTVQRKDGSMIKVGVHSAHATYRGRPAIIGMMQDISEKKRAEEQIQRYVEQLRTAFMSTVEVATTLSEMRDPYTAGHERRVAGIAVAIGAELGFDAHRQEGLRVAGYLHDIGKITIPTEILTKPGKLSAVEFKLIRGHAQASFDVLKGVAFPWPVAQIALQHHERIDGSGYPQGLKGDAILLEARVMAVADVVEAMSSHRPYRPALGIEAALVEIERGRGTVYDPVVADACLKQFREKDYAIPA